MIRGDVSVLSFRRSHKSSAVVLEPRGSTASRPQGSQPPSFGSYERPHANHRTVALGSLASTRPVRQRQEHRAALGHHGEQTERHNAAVAHEL